MTVTKEQVLDKAKELGLNLTDAEVDKLVADGKLPEKKEPYAGTSIDDLISKYSPRQLAEMLTDTRSEAKDRRLEAKALKENAELLTKEINSLKEISGKYPELETKMKTIETQLQAAKDGERKRRGTLLAKLPDDKKVVFDYLLNVEAIPSEKFDITIESLIQPKVPGMNIPPPGEPPTTNLTPVQQAEARKMGLSDEAYAEVQAGRKTKQ